MHFLTLVIGDDPEEQLAPFQEVSEWTDGVSPIEFHDVEAEYLERYHRGNLDDPWTKRDRPEQYQKPIREVFPTFDDYMAAVFGPRDDRTGRYGEWFNPNAKFDWYLFGGRFARHLILKPGRIGGHGHTDSFTSFDGRSHADQARKGDIDFKDMTRASFHQFLSAWDVMELTWGIDQRSKWDRDFPETVLTREQLICYAERRSVHNAPAATVINGEWFGPWWIEHDMTEAKAERWDRWFSAQLAQLPDDTLLTVIDCHTV